MKKNDIIKMLKAFLKNKVLCNNKKIQKIAIS